MRWVNGRYAVLQGQKPHQGHTAALQRTDQVFRTVGRYMSLDRKALADDIRPGAGCGNRRKGFQRLADGGPASRVLSARRPFATKDTRLDQLSLTIRLLLQECIVHPFVSYTDLSHVGRAPLFLTAFVRVVSRSVDGLQRTISL